MRQGGQLLDLCGRSLQFEQAVFNVTLGFLNTKTSKVNSTEIQSCEKDVYRFSILLLVSFEGDG